MQKFLILFFLSSLYLYGYKNCIITIDPGHTKKRFGTISATGITEYTYNIKIAKTLDSLFNNDKNTTSFIINPNGEKIKFENIYDLYLF